MALFKFAGVLRARVAQENAAKAEVARSRAAANAAMAEVHRQSATLDEADVIVENRKADLAAAARQRKAMEKLAERHAATRRHRADVAERAEVDDLTNGRYTASQRNQRKDRHGD